MKTKKILYLFLLPLIFTACETKDIPVYTSDDAALYFQRTASYIWGSTTVTYSNSTEFTFAGAAAEKKQCHLFGRSTYDGKCHRLRPPF